MEKLICKNLEHNYFGGETNAIHLLNTTFSSGLNIIYGNLGSGKTTLLRCIAGLEEYRGEIYFNDVLLEKKIKNRGVMMLFDDYALFPHKTGLYNLIYPLIIRGEDRKKAEEIGYDLAKKFDIGGHILDNTPHHLQKAEKARLALARMFIRKEKIKLFDNPFASLSPDERRELFEIMLRNLREEKDDNTIYIYGTDSSEEVLTLRANTLLLDYGYLIAEGDPYIMRVDSPCEFALSHLSDYSVIKTAILEDNGLKIGKTFLPYNSERNLIHYNKQEVRIGFAADRINIYPIDTSDNIDNLILATVKGIYYHNDRKILSLIADNNDELSVFAYYEGEVAIGDKVNIRIEDIMIFDAVNGRRIDK